MHEHPLRRCLVESQTEKLNSTHSWTYITRIYNWAQSHFKQRHVQHRSSWWVGVWQSQLWKIASEWSHTAYLQKLHAHTNTHSFFTGLYCMHLWLSSITNAAFSYSFTPSLYHSLSSSALPLFFVSLSPWSPLKHVSLLQAFFFMWSFQLFLLHSNAIFGKQLPVLRSRERQRRERKGIQCSAPHGELGSKYASFVLKWLLSCCLSTISVVQFGFGVHLSEQHMMGHRNG